MGCIWELPKAGRFRGQSHNNPECLLRVWGWGSEGASQMAPVCIEVTMVSG